jgi:hypothetical protein
MTAFAFIIAFGIVVSRAITHLLRRSGRAPNSLLLRSLDARPTGPNATWTRRDHLRAAGIHALTFAGCVVLALTIMAFADRWPNGSSLNMGASFPGLVLMFLGLVYLWLALRSILRAALSVFRRSAA